MRKLQTEFARVGWSRVGYTFPRILRSFSLPSLSSSSKTNILVVMLILLEIILFMPLSRWKSSIVICACVFAISLKRATELKLKTMPRKILCNVSIYVSWIFILCDAWRCVVIVPSLIPQWLQVTSEWIEMRPLSLSIYIDLVKPKKKKLIFERGLQKEVSPWNSKI